MSENTKHTPGPWKWRNVGFYWVLEGRGGAYRVIDDGSASGEYSAAINLGEPDKYPADHANAMLIAAAPDLLAALEGLVSDLGDLARVGPDSTREAFKVAFSAIAKAKGESNG